MWICQTQAVPVVKVSFVFCVTGWLETEFIAAAVSGMKLGRVEM